MRFIVASHCGALEPTMAGFCRRARSHGHPSMIPPRHDRYLRVSTLLRLAPSVSTAEMPKSMGSANRLVTAHMLKIHAIGEACYKSAMFSVQRTTDERLAWQKTRARHTVR